LGVAFFFGVAAFLAAVFLGAAFLVALGAAGAVVFVTRPDLVFPRTRETSDSTAGAGAVLRGLLAFALGFAAAAATFLGAALVDCAATVFFGAAFLVVVALAFCGMGQQQHTDDSIITHTVAVAFLGAAFFSVLGSAFFATGAVAAGFASLTVPEAPDRWSARFLESTETRRQSRCVDATGAKRWGGADIPLGREKSPFSSPEAIARLT